ncbi:CU044_5270 family protein [Streptomyces sp. NBC_00250]|uniref:CU044_5270 family protein n=1 Tax=Streptomyces sp. NBC_00250 TaxID=2903641 RepID=UPI002E2E15A5|nr:CU044_5270 family protein [Streptomyces sp. NBC_00250]
MNAFAPRTPRHQDHGHADAHLRAELAELLPPPPVPELAPERDRDLRHTVLRTALASGDGAGVRPPRARRAGAKLRLGWIAAPVAACAVVAGAVVLAPQDPPAGSPGRISAGQQASPGAVQVLSRAALAAAAAPAPDALPEGYVYVRSLVAHAGRSAAGGSATLPPVHRREVWLSADGSRPGLLREPGSADIPLGAPLPVYELDHRGATPRKTTAGAEPPSVTNPTHAYVATLPTDPEALLRLIRDETRGRGDDGGDPDQRAFTAIGTLLAETWAPPKVTAALYEAAARIPGVTVLPSAKDAAGREGVAVARTAHGEQTQWIFDRTSSAFLGERTVLTATTSAGPSGTVLGVSAVLAKAAVGAPGELPGAPKG